MGKLSGSSKPTFCAFNDVLLIASGGQLQQMTNAHVLTTIANSPKTSYVMEKDGRVVASGDSDNPSRVYQSAYFDQTTWEGTTSDYADVGYKDKLSVKGIHEAFDGLYLVFKRGSGGLRTYFLTALSETAPESKKVSEVHCAKNHHTIINAASKVYFVEDKGVSYLVGIDAQGKVAVDPTVGLKLANLMDPESTAHACVYPRDKQLWVVPNTSSNKVYVCHYLRDHAWTAFSFGSRKIHSMYYLPSDQKLYLGCDDGYVYRYEVDNNSYQDEGSVNYDQVIKTKVFDEPADKDKIVKTPRLFYEALTTSSMTFAVKDDYGTTTAYTDDFDVTTTSYKLYDLQNTYIYDTQAGGDDELYLYDAQGASVMADKKWDVNINCENFQFTLTVSSGGIRVDKFVARMATGQYK